MKGPKLTRWAYDELKARIMDDRLPAGSSHLEQALAEALGISRTPVREAALRLEAEGFVAIRPRLGIHIRPISTRDMAEIYALLTELEPFAARLLAERGLAPAEAADLGAAVDAMERCLADGDLGAWAAADRAFHEALIRRTGNERLLRIVSMLWDQVHRTRMATLSARTDLGRSNEDHRRLVELIAAGEAEAAEALHRRHRATAGAALVALLAEREREEEEGEDEP